MTLDKLKDPKVQEYINASLKADLHSLLLKKSPFDGLSMQDLVQQIQGKKIAEKKFPFLLREGIIFPPHLNLEQSSSEATGNYKRSLIKGKSFIDLTSGFGIDSYFLSQDFEEVSLVEQNTSLFEIVRSNWSILGRKAVFINSELEDFLSINTKKFDCIFLDPARRDSNKNKVFLLEDLSPNILAIQDELLRVGKQVLIKLSPLIDITYLLSVLKNVTDIHIVAVKNDVKEILVSTSSLQDIDNVNISCINLESGDTILSFNFDEISTAKSTFGPVEDYLYIPNNSVLKSGAFNLVSQHFNLVKLHPNTHFYTSKIYNKNFPGRVLKVEAINPKELKKGDKFNIISKNYPLKPDQIKKKYKINDGGEQYLIFTEDIKGKVVYKSTEIL